MISIQFPETITAKCTHTGGNLKSISFLSSLLLAFIEASAIKHSSSWMPPSKLMHFQKTPSLSIYNSHPQQLSLLRPSASAIDSQLFAQPDGLAGT